MSSYLQNLKAVETPDKQTVVLRFTGAAAPREGRVRWCYRWVPC